jgi:Domain of unknown function (DUF4342)
MDAPKEKASKTIIEEIEVAGSQLIAQVTDLLKKGNVRQLRIRAGDGDVFLETPVNVGIIAGGAVALAAPWLAVLGVIAALVAKVRIEIEREPDKSAQANKQKDQDAA